MSSDTVAIDVEGLGKVYRVFPTPPDRLKQLLWRGRRNFYDEFWALHPISFQVRRGECVGFLGKNGSGKSTLLQMIAGTLDPSHGSFKVAGRLSALLELGAGFNPEFTGRENVILSGALLGISAREMQERLPKIIQFSELDEFIEKPVKTYSSGMYVRLAFSAAVHVEPDVLLVDEALSVGDAAFQYKCMERINHLRSRGMSILFVTHDTGAVRKICDKAFWLDSGNLVSFGDATAVADDYDSFMRSKSLSLTNSSEEVPDEGCGRQEEGLNLAAASAQSYAIIRSVEVRDRSERPIEVVCIGGEIKVVVTYEVTQETSGLIVGVAIFRNDQLYVSGLNTSLDNFRVPSAPGTYSVALSLPSVSLVPGNYFCKVGLFDSTGLVKWDFWDNCGSFKVFGPYLAEGVVIPKHSWLISSVRS